MQRLPLGANDAAFVAVDTRIASCGDDLTVRVWRSDDREAEWFLQGVTELQALMRHRNFTTTLGYITMAKQLAGNPTDKLFVPDVYTRQQG